MAGPNINPSDELLCDRLRRIDYEATPDDVAYARILTRDPCCYCGAIGRALDHIDPLLNGWQNLTATCRACNTGKSRRSLLAYLLSAHLRRERDGIVAQLALLAEHAA